MQGTFEREILPHIGLPHRVFQHVHGIELHGKVNFLKAGAEFATIVGTHSPSHAQRIQEIDRGYGLEDTFRVLYPDEPIYSWWDYRAGDFHKGKGLRIDLVLGSKPIVEAMTFSLIDRQARKGTSPSDHAPVLIDVEPTW